MNFDYSKRPGKEIELIGEIKNTEEPTISIITPFYNGGKTLQETANSVFSQTYPYFEWIIVDDGSKDEESLKELNRVAKQDKRIKVFHKENAGPSQARDYGVSKASKQTKYLFFLDCDDLLDKTMLECLYWTLETHPDGSFAYTTMINFGAREFFWERYLTVDDEKEENLICVCSLVKKEDFHEVGGFEIKEKAMYEDWNLWLKLIKAGKKPIRTNAPVFWYRTSNSGELSRAKENHENAMKYVNETASQITEDVEIIQFPREGKKYDTVKSYPNMVLPKYKDNKKTNILFIVPWAVTGGADFFNLDLIKRLDKEKYDVTLLMTTPNENPIRQQFEEVCSAVYDMTTFLERSDYINFTDYIMESRNIDLVFVTNTPYGYYMIPYLKRKYPTVPFIDYIHSVDLRDPRESFGRCTMDVDKYLSHTYCCNNFTKKQLSERYHKDNVETIYIGTDSNKFDPKQYDSKKMREKYGIPQDKTVISFIARLSDEKRPEMFVEIGKRLIEKNPNLFFVIAGDGFLYHSVSSIIDDNFKMLGMIQDTEEIYALSDMTLNCSSLEGLALTSYESLSMGIPVVSTDVGGQTELIDDKVGGIVHYHKNATPEEYEEEINNYVKETERVISNLDEIKGNCRKKILAGFTLDIMAKKFDKIFTDTIKEEKKNKVKYPINDYMEYNLLIENLYIDYFFTVKNYLETKFDIYYDPDQPPRKKGRLYYFKRRLSKVLNRAHAKQESLTILNALRCLYKSLKNFIYFLKFFILSIPAAFVLFYKLLMRNRNNG